MKSMGFALQVFTGLILGVSAGLFFGEYCEVLEPIGRVFIMLLEAFLYPFLISSLLYGLGKLDPKSFISLIKRGWIFYLSAWLVTLISLGILIQSFPKGSPLLIDPTEVSNSVNRFLVLFFPQNVFLDFTRNFIPAVVVFSVLLGLAVQGFEKKKSALDVFEAVSRSSITVWQWIIKFSPIAVFALFANLFGTVSISQLDSMMVYLLLFVIGSLVLTFWIIPGLISAFIDYPVREILKRMGAGVFMGAATMLPVTAIPYILKLTGELAQERMIGNKGETGLKETVISFSYPLVQLGNVFVYLFVGFSAFYYKYTLNLAQELLLPLLSVLSTFGTPVASVNAVSFLSSWLDFSRDNTELYVELMTITRYFQVIATVAGLYFITIVVTFAYYRKLRFRLRRLTVHLVLPFMVLSLVACGLFEIEKRRGPGRTDLYLSLSMPDGVRSDVNATIYRGDDTSEHPTNARVGLENKEGTFKRIQRTGVLRVGYNATPLPFSYFNENGELVGYDVAFAYNLAKTLRVNLEFVPYTWKGLIGDLEANRFDMAISGIYVTQERIRHLTVSKPYFRSSVVMVTRSENSKTYYSRETISSAKGLRIGVFDDNVLLKFVQATFPDAQVVLVSSLDEMLSFKGLDSFIWTKEQAVLLASMKPGLSVVMTQDLHSPFLFAYMMPPEANELGKYVDYWLELRKDDGFEERMRAYWFDGKTDAEPARPWSVIRNVLHWVD